MQQTENQSGTSTLPGLASIVLTGVLIAGCASVTPPQIVPISNVTSAAENGQSSGQIIGAMNTSKTIYAMRGSDFAKLADRGVSEPVLDELQQRFFSEVEFLTRNYYANGTSGGPSSIYPQPLDLDNLDAGGNGMATATSIGQVTHGTRPQGVPKWVPPYPAVTGPVISVNTVLDMTNAGKTTEEIVESVRGSRIDILYADNNYAMSRSRTAALTGSTYARLGQQGVAPDVLDAIQATYYAQHVERSRKIGSRGTGGGFR